MNARARELLELLKAATWDEDEHPRDRRGRFAERDAPEWQDPPPPRGTLGDGRKAGGYSSDKAAGTNTSLGREGEALFVGLTGGEILHPPGKGEQSPLDVRVGDVGYEVKAVSVDSTSFKATPKPHEIESKLKFADELGVKPALAIVVIDRQTGKAYMYRRFGMKGGRLSKSTGWEFMGTQDLPVQKTAEHWLYQIRDRVGRWTDSPAAAAFLLEARDIGLAPRPRTSVPHLDDDQLREKLATTDIMSREYRMLQAEAAKRGMRITRDQLAGRQRAHELGDLLARRPSRRAGGDLLARRPHAENSRSSRDLLAKDADEVESP